MVKLCAWTSLRTACPLFKGLLCYALGFVFSFCVKFTKWGWESVGEGKGDSHISVNPFPWETCRSRLRLHRCRAGRTGQGQKDRDGNVATASSQQVRDRQLTDLWTEGATRNGSEGQMGALSTGEVKASCRSPNMLPTPFPPTIALYSSLNCCEPLRLRKGSLNITGLNKCSFLVPWWPFANFLKS